MTGIAAGRPWRGQAYRALLALVVLIVGGCGGGLGGNNFEYSELQIEPGRYWVSVAGSSQFDRRAVERALVRRAAQIALDAGHESFVIEDQQTRSSERPVYVDIAADFPTSTSGRTVRLSRFTTIGIIAVFSGATAPVEGRVFNARKVLADGAPG